MSLESSVESVLQAKGTFQNQRENLLVHEGALQFSAELCGLDSLGCAFTHCSLENPGLAGADIGQLKALADKLSARLTYLLEPLRTLEIDQDSCTVQMRSHPPHLHDGKITYYELLVQKGVVITLSRFVKESGSSRTIVPAQVTREVFLRLVRDFAAAAA